MSLGLFGVVIFLGVGIGLWLVSNVVEVLRPVPVAPETLLWAPDIPIKYINASGCRLRYIRSGRGPNLVLLHTLRTQLDLFEKVVPNLAKHFTVYALDYPGHGFSDIPKAQYDADFFVQSVEDFLDALDLHDVALCGVSIGGAIALIIAGKRNHRVSRVMAINPYDYDNGRGMARSSFLGWLITVTSENRLIAETVMRLRHVIIIKAVLQGGVVNPQNIPRKLLKEMYDVGNRPGHYRAFISLLRNAASWEVATKVYSAINAPVLLVWGEKDWARPAERERDRALIPAASMLTIENGGHFLPLDRPDALTAEVEKFAAGS